MNLKFWQKDSSDDFSLPDMDSDSSAFNTDLSGDFESPQSSSFPDSSMNSQSLAPDSSFDQQAYAPAQNATPAQDDVHTQLILARLDAISNKLDVLSSRVEKVESLINAQDQKQASQKRGPWYGQ